MMKLITTFPLRPYDPVSVAGLQSSVLRQSAMFYYDLPFVALDDQARCVSTSLPILGMKRT